ncbi:NAD(P)H-binding protein [Aureimonas sp. AU40]|uniref:NAD(P)H-binding protein n=1 Tax=Aureimonas sp. AU40 TaxID=1637747 RepID=UPI000784A1BF|nr:NAD(P)H-binding protein [Aureimonas sp. AU40]
MRLLLLGATGLVGGEVLKQALRDPRLTEIIAPVRRAIPAQGKLRAAQIDFEHLPEQAEWWAAEAVISALGTTRRKAGSAAAFRHVDHDLTLSALRLARAQGTPTLALVSAAGANAGSPFLYPRVKGETEQAVKELGFSSATILRPGLIGGERSEHRAMERIALTLAGAAGPILPKALRINPAERIASRLLDAVLTARPGLHIVRSAELA